MFILFVISFNIIITIMYSYMKNENQKKYCIIYRYHENWFFCESFCTICICIWKHT